MVIVLVVGNCLERSISNRKKTKMSQRNLPSQLHGVATCAFYGYQFGVHYRCHSNYGIRWCEHYLHLSGKRRPASLSLSVVV